MVIISTRSQPSGNYMSRRLWHRRFCTVHVLYSGGPMSTVMDRHKGSRTAERIWRTDGHTLHLTLVVSAKDTVPYDLRCENVSVRPLHNNEQSVHFFVMPVHKLVPATSRTVTNFAWPHNKISPHLLLFRTWLTTLVKQDRTLSLRFT